MPHSSMYAGGNANMGVSRTSIVSSGSRQCLVRNCKRTHCKREYIVRGTLQYEYSEYCKDHTCFRDIGDYPSFCPAPATHAGSEVCNKHSECSFPGCGALGKNNEPYADQNWYCRSHRCRHANCITAALSGRKHCQNHLACAKNNCDRIPTEKSTFCTQHECSFNKCHQRADEEGRCDQHRACHASSCTELAMRDAYYCSLHRCRNALCDTQRAKDSFFCAKHCCKTQGCNESCSQTTGTPYCSRHACSAHGCVNAARSLSIYCDELHACAIPHCRGQRTKVDAEGSQSLCIEHYVDLARKQAFKQSQAYQKRKEAEYEETSRFKDYEIRRLEAEAEARALEKEAKIKKRREEEREERAFKRGKKVGQEQAIKKEEEAKQAAREARIAREEASRRAEADAIIDDFADMRRREPEHLPRHTTSQRHTRVDEQPLRSRAGQREHHWPADSHGSVSRPSAPRPMPTPVVEVVAPEDLWDEEPENYYTHYASTPRRRQAPYYHDDHGRGSTYYQAPPPTGSMPRRAFSPEQVVYAQYPVTPERSRSFRHIQRHAQEEDYGVPYVSGSRRRDEPLPYPDPQEHIDRHLRRSETYRY